ncbi:MAG: hypothetical protein IJ833_00310, partial [Lachnospiraceae bacterium]|nr:hypothetical protein [Lachnospiraceae bacterium]
GEKNCAGVLTDLQMQLYLVMVDFQKRKNKKGQEYGMPVSILLPPEVVWGDVVSAAYQETPEESRMRIEEHIRALYPQADEKAIRKMVK